MYSETIPKKSTIGGLPHTMKHALRTLCCLCLTLAMLLGTLSIGITPAYAAEMTNPSSLPGEERGLRNLSTMGGTAIATFYQTNGDICPPQNAVDGDVNTRWSTYAAPQKAPHAIMVDLGRESRIELLHMYWMNPNRTITYDVYVTNEPTITNTTFATDATPVLTGHEGKGCAADNLQFDTAELPTPVIGRYVTLYITAVQSTQAGDTGACAAMYELYVMGKPADLTGFEITSFRTQSALYADVGTQLSALTLPSTVTATLANGESENIPVSWTCPDYDPDRSATYTFLGTPQPDDTIWATNPDGLTVQKQVILTDISDGGRVEQPLNDGWSFYRGALSGAEKVSYDDSAFTAVTLPHTWNAEDGADGGNNYYRGEGWYRRSLPWRDSYAGKRVYLYFEGVGRECVVYVNGREMGAHRGAYTAFYIDITDALKSGDNIIAVKASNADVKDLYAISGDFTQWGGIYRDVTLVVTGEQHINTDDYGADGLYMTTTNVSPSAASVSVRATVVNDGDTAREISLMYTLGIPATEDITWIDEISTAWLPFDPADMSVPGGEMIYCADTSLTLGAGESYTWEHTFTVQDPHLWNGLSNPFRYIGELQVMSDGTLTDSVSDYLGFRSFEVDPNDGAFLNGVSYNLRGVSRHQDREGMGSAITAAEHNEDFAMIYEMGANSVRLAHYPQADYFYDLCDQYGIVVWAEACFVNDLGGSGTYDNPDQTRATFMDTVRTQIRELIRQQYNHPSIVVWCIQNEVEPAESAIMIPFCTELTALCHSEDPTRYVTQATANGSNSGWPSDLICTNLYPGWYYSDYTQLKSYIDNFRNSAGGRAVGISEYGLGANYEHHCEGYPAVVCKSDIAYQYEEYQAEGHESYIAQIEQMDYLWCTYVWNMFDFGVDHRYEAQVHGINNKGLVSYDRTIRKDAFYLYKANWSDLPTLHITSSRFTYRGANSIPVKIYSNCESVTLYVNGEKIGTLTQEDLAQETVFLWLDVALQNGENTVRTVGTLDGVEYTDEVTWYYASLSSDLYTIDNTEQKITLPATAVRIEDVAKDILCNVDATLTVYAADGETVLHEGVVTDEMMLKVSLGKDARWYSFIRINLALGAQAIATYEQSGCPATHASDGKETTYWSTYGTSTYPQGIQLDLGTTQELGELRLMLFGDNRNYTYDVYITDEPALESYDALIPTMENLVGRGYGAAGGLPTNAEYERVTLPEGTSGRYITVIVKECDVAGVKLAAIWEIEAYGAIESVSTTPEDDTPIAPPDDTPNNNGDNTVDDNDDNNNNNDDSKSDTPDEPKNGSPILVIVIVAAALLLVAGAAVLVVMRRKKK